MMHKMKNKTDALFPMGSAEFSPDRKFRYRLWRIWDTFKPFIMFVGLNPSTADESGDDATIKRVKLIAFNNGYGGVFMMNCFPLVSRDPKALEGIVMCNEYIDNFGYCMDTAKDCEKVVFAWGNFKVVKQHGVDQSMAGMFPDAYALAINKDGSPQHPLFMKGTTVPIPYVKKPVNSL